MLGVRVRPIVRHPITDWIGRAPKMHQMPGGISALDLDLGMFDYFGGLLKIMDTILKSHIRLGTNKVLKQCST